MRHNAQKHRERPVCPHCTSQYVRHPDTRNRKLWACKKCEREFEFTPPPPSVTVVKVPGLVAQPVREREWKPLRRDPFELMKLCSRSS